MRSIPLLIAAWLALLPPGLARAACLVDADCSDGSLCTGTERCVSGTCQRGPSLDCNDSNPCTVDDCDRLVGCLHAAVADATSCGDGVFCNGAETCQRGACIPGQASPNGTSCDDGNKCTAGDTCQTGTCVGTTRSDGVQCSDGNPCNGLELCFSGDCTPGQAKSDGTACGDGNPCNGAESCQAGRCVAGTRLPDGALCADGSVCNGTETCKSGLCTTGPPPPNGSSCSDGNLCNGSETCHDQVCISSASLNCNDGNPCTTDSCNQLLGCQHANRSDGTRCADPNDCNGIETCQSGLCKAGIPEVDGIPCSDDNPCNGFEVCKSAICSPGTPSANGTSCSDRNPCNGTESCQNGECASGTPPSCNDENPCTLDTCTASQGCQNLQLVDGSSCDDDDVCNGLAVCTSGQCTAGTSLVCTDADPLTLDGCDPRKGCTRDRPIAGGLLNLRSIGSGRWAIRVSSEDGSVLESSLLENGSDADPVINGAVIRLVSHAPGEDFDARFDLPAAGWSYLGTPGDNSGYRYRDRSAGAAIRVVQLRANRPWKFTGRGSTIGPHLGVDPQPVAVHLTLGHQRYCMSFGGSAFFIPAKQYRATHAPTPSTCEP